MTESDAANVLERFFPKLDSMSPLQEQVAKLGICLKCHTKTLCLRYSAEGLEFHQCSECLVVYVLEPEST